MSKITWSNTGERFFEAGVDRGVLYVGNDPGVAWNGLTAVQETPSGGEVQPYFLDGIKLLNKATVEEFEAVITAYFSPKEFDVCDGSVALAPGLVVTGQERRSFGLCYRTRLGNDVDGVNHAYKLHLIYNATAAPTEHANESINAETEPGSLSWAVKTVPVRVPGVSNKPTSHIILDSRDTPPELMAYLEEYLYGSDSLPPRLPSPDVLISVYNDTGDFVVTYLGDGLYSVQGWPVEVFIDGLFSVEHETAILLGDGVFALGVSDGPGTDPGHYTGNAVVTLVGGFPSIDAASPDATTSNVYLVSGLPYFDDAGSGASQVVTLVDDLPFVDLTVTSPTDPPVDPPVEPPVIDVVPPSLAVAFSIDDGPQVTLDAPLNGYRNIGYAVLYTDEVFNEYGIQAAVNGTTRLITEISDRNGNPATGAPTVPAGGFGISIHGTSGTGGKGDAFRAVAHVGSKVTLFNSTGGGTDPDPDPDPEPGDGSTPSAAMPDNFSGMWVNVYEAPMPSAMQATARSHINHFIFAPAESSSDGTGSLNMPNASSVWSNAQYVRGLGANAVIGIGGSGGAAIRLQTVAHANQMFASIQSFITASGGFAAGINGIDLDMEIIGNWLNPGVVSLFTQLKTTYGSNFIIGVTPGMYGDNIDDWQSLATACDDLVDYWAPMQYDRPEASNDLAHTASVNWEQLKSAGVPNSKLVMMMMFQTTTPYYNLANVSPREYAYTQMQTMLNNYPNMAGFCCWVLDRDADGSPDGYLYPYSNRIAPLILAR